MVRPRVVPDLYIANPIVPIKDGDGNLVTGSIGVTFSLDGKTQTYYKHDVGDNTKFTRFQTYTSACNTGASCKFVTGGGTPADYNFNSISTDVGPTVDQLILVHISCDGRACKKLKNECTKWVGDERVQYTSKQAKQKQTSKNDDDAQRHGSKG